MNPQRIIDRPEDVQDKLAELGLNLEIIVSSVTAGVAARRECIRTHPRTAPGFYAWSECVRALRDQLLPLGWELNNEANQGLAFNPNKSIMLGVAPGNSSTGKKGVTPRTRTPRGVRTLAAVASNSGYLFVEMEEDEIVRLFSSRSDLWLLLLFFDEENERVQVELSRPVKANEEKRLVDWRPRILLGSIDFSNGSRAKSRNDVPPPQSSSEIVVEVKRRA